ncbi:bifunctional 3-(3-hydroxy-phenyl)propionate/3-hydroxycinnamic acid hydroxylase [Actinoplanes sp. LDG1-06]|uniref:Bifunctional 3-(3-hydroxy-phenyl)propionate/3-hydroxycinnamic acid hydroxylase n=1 Tax=Paractinoplanes ovalisporus TaxID=2810368 RepID=A0ABS2AIM4_9ACTN|nr:bifunctional 3-(3-hydroxy-phenyl)propionate/3-hydroxycinnamic acid hydroxylase [Actinoplanes ovalisporus]MBM2619672.1 bifunctional 3-(3-hydroxy-phenyl)propionate/3-hydroxycinnamic acid hydroxylase [Actinoplanes ovalisporus]
MTDVDVAIVGCGPVGLVLGIAVAQRGWKVAILERYQDQYPFPRVVAFDGETARNFATVGLNDDLYELGEPVGEYDFQNAAGETLLHLDNPYEPDRDGWPKAVIMHQPTFEAALRAHARTLPNLELRTAYQVESLTDHGDHVELNSELTASWVVGCDGANSFVREHIGTPIVDLNFEHDWLLCDVVFHEPRTFKPNDVQICDPRRPTTIVSSGRGHRRWEFMRLPGETLEELSREDRMWELLAPHGVTPDNADLTRHIVYTFKASIVRDWRRGRLLLAGDSAHLMPPFIGQGMCSGIRDAVNLAWKLDLVLRGTSGDDLFDAYVAERDPHVRSTTALAIEVGKMISELDPAAAALRDKVMFARQQDPAQAGVPQYFALTDGIVRRDAEGAVAGLAGDLVPQGRVTRGGRTAMFDDVVGRGFVLLATFDPYLVLDEDDRSFLKELGAHVVRVLPGRMPAKNLKDHEVVDTDGVYLPYLTGARQVGALVRPDFYLYGSASSRPDLSTLVKDLRAAL